MIKFFGLIPRISGMAPQRFHDHWRHPHGTLALPIETYRGYVQSHQFPHIALGEATSVFEGFAEVWFDGANGEGPNGRHQVYDWPATFTLVRRLQPDAVIFSDAGPDLRPQWRRARPQLLGLYARDRAE